MWETSYRSLTSLLPMIWYIFSILDYILFRRLQTGYFAEFIELNQVNKLRLEADGLSDDAPEMHHVEGAFVETLL